MSSAAWGQQAPEITLTEVDLEGPCLRVRFETSIVGLGSISGLYYGKDTDPSDELRTRKFPTTSGSVATRSDRTCDLAPNTKYYFQPYATDLAREAEGRFACTEVCQNCDFGDGLSAASCDAVGEPPHLTTDASFAVESPTAPTHSFDAAAPPDIDGEVFPVAVDSENRCIDFEEQVAAAAEAPTDLWHRVEIPPGAVCELKLYRLPERTGPGFGQGGVVITTAGDSRLFPPPGVRIDPSYKPVLAKLRPSVEEATAYGWFGVNSEAWLDFRSGPDGYRFQNLDLAPQDHRQMPVRQFEIVDIAVNGSIVTITLDRDHLFAANQLVTVQVNPECIGLQGVRRVGNRSGNQFDITSQIVSGQCTGGMVTQAVSIPIASCSAATPVRCDTAVPHGLPVYETLPILSIGGASNNVLTVYEMHKMSPSGRYIRGKNVVRISGSPGGAWDGLHVANSAGVTSITLVGSFDSSCSADCGFYQRVDPIQVADTGSDDIDGSHHFEVVDEDTFDLLSASAASPTTGGFFAFDPDVIFAFLPIGNGGGERIVLDRVLIDCGGFPYRAVRCIDATSDRLAIVNSFLQEGNFWSPVDPLANFWQTLWQGVQFLFIHFGVHFTTAEDFQVKNNTFWEFRGISWFADASVNPPESDISFERNLMYTTDALTAGKEGSNGRYYANRHCWEQKAAERVALEGNWFSGLSVDQHPGGHCLVGSPRSAASWPERSIRDVMIRDNVVERAGAFLQFAGDDGPEKNVPPNRRLAVINNLMRDIDYFEERSSPSGTGATGFATGFGGYLLSTMNAMADFTMERNTWMPARGHQTSLIRFDRFTNSLLNVERNIFSTPGGIGALSTDLFPSCQGLDWPGRFDCFVRRETQRDPLSTFDDNVMLGCVEYAGTVDDEAYLADFTSTEAVRTVHRSEVIDDWAGIEQSVPNLYAGRATNDDSCAERVEQIFQDASYRPELEFAGRGADIDALLDGLGQIREVSIARPTNESLQFFYQAPDASACWVDLTDEPLFTVAEAIVRVSDGGGAIQRSVEFPTTGAGKRWYRVLCPAHQARGVVEITN